MNEFDVPGKPLMSYMANVFYAHMQEHPPVSIPCGAVWVGNKDHAVSLTKEGSAEIPVQWSGAFGLRWIFVDLPMEFPVIGHPRIEVWLGYDAAAPGDDSTVVGWMVPE